MAAAAEAAKLATKRTAYPPSSPFAELLRHSRFGSFDPQIRQTYYSPPENVSRGDWGLKRPLTLRRKDAHITLKEYEHRAFFVEWSRGDAQANLIKRLDEANVTPRLPSEDKDGITWLAQLGKKKSQWLIDSEYCPEDEDAAAFGVAPQYEEWNGPDVAYELLGDVDLPIAMDEEGEVESVYDMRGVEGTEDMEGTEGMEGFKGFEGMENMVEGEDVQDILDYPEFRGMYGADRPLPPPKQEEWQVNDFVQPNIYAMSPRQFNAYLKKMRKLRPQFLEWLKKHAEINPNLVGKRISDLHNDALTLHREFLSEYWKKQYNDPSSIRMEPQPHTFGALSYARMSDLDSTFSRRYEPGIILHDDQSITLQNQEEEPPIPKHTRFMESKSNVRESVTDEDLEDDEKLLEELEEEDNGEVLEIDVEDGVHVFSEEGEAETPEEQAKLDELDRANLHSLYDLEEMDHERVSPPHVVSFSGLTAVLHTGEKPPHVKPLIKDRAASTIDPSRAESATASMAFGPGSLVLYRPPRVVGPFAEGLKGVQIAADVIINPIEYQRSEKMEERAAKELLPDDVKSQLKADVEEYRDLMARTEEIAENEPFVDKVIDILNAKCGIEYSDDEFYVKNGELFKWEDADDDNLPLNLDEDEAGKHRKLLGNKDVLGRLQMMLGKDDDSSGPHGL